MTSPIYHASPRFPVLPRPYSFWVLVLSRVPLNGQARSFQPLQDSKFSADEKYQAAILLSYTYKRVEDYQSTLLFLEKARNFARQSPAKEMYLAQQKQATPPAADPALHRPVLDLLATAGYN